MHAQSPSPSEVKNLSPDKRWEYDCPQSIEYEVHEWSDPGTAIVYAYEEDGEETGKTIRVDLLFTLKFDEGGKLKIVKTQQLSEAESQKYQQDSQN
jgi:hypothetical protein